MSSPVIVPIVEGQSETRAVPVLLRRVFAEKGNFAIQIAQPIRVSRYKVVKPNELERSLELAKRRPKGCDAILLLLDAEDDCPKDLAKELLERMCQARGSSPMSVVIAKHEFENWFLGSLESLRGVRGISKTAESPNDPEKIRDAKGHISALMPHGQRYIEVDDQPAFAATFDMQAARNNCPSFDKLVRDLQSLLKQI